MSDRYEIRSKIAQGGLGAVYMAHDVNLDREVALKRVLPDAFEQDPEAASALVKEAKVLSSLQHPNIVTVYDVGQDAEGPYVVMELLKGETLDKTMKRGALPAADFEQLVTQCLEGLIAAQDVGLVHRDLKPANIMVIWHASGKFQLKILDFGLAKFSRQPSKQTIDQGDGIMGSIYFMAPEQFERGDLDGRTDLYAIGSIFYYTLTTQYPYQGDSAPQVMASHLQHKYKPLSSMRPDLPSWISGWLDWLMARQSLHRPTSAKEALDFFRAEKFRTEEEREKIAVKLKAQAKAKAEKEAAEKAQAAAQGTVAPKAAPTPTGVLPAAPTGVLPANPPVAQPSGKLVAGTPSGSTSQRLATGGGAEAKTAAKATPVLVAGAAAPTPTGALQVPKAETAGGPTMQAGGMNVGVGEAAPTLETADAGVQEAVAVAVPDEPVGMMKRIPKWAFITVPLIVLVGGALVTKFLIDNNNRNKRNARFGELSDAVKPEGTPADVRLLLGFINDKNSTDDQRSGAAIIMSKLDGDGVGDEILANIENANSTEGKVNMITALTIREYADSMPMMLEKIESTNPKIRKAAWNCIAMVGTRSDVPSLIEALEEVGAEERMFAESAIISVCSSAGTDDQKTREVLTAINMAGDDTKRSLMKIAAALSTDSALTRLTGMLDSPDGMTAAQALGLWRTAAPLPELVKFVEGTDVEAKKIVGLQSISQVAQSPSMASNGEIISLLAKAAEQATRSREKTALLATILQLADPSAIPTVQRIADDNFKTRMLPQYIGKMEAALAKVVPVSGATELEPVKATIIGEGARISNGVVTSWMGVDATLKWDINVTKPGTYKVSVNQASTHDKGEYKVYGGGLDVEADVVDTGGNDTFKEVNVGSMKFSKPGYYSIWVTGTELGEEFTLMELKGIKLTP